MKQKNKGKVYVGVLPIFGGFPFSSGVHQFTGPDAEGSAQLQDHLEAGLLFTAFQAANEGMHHAHPFAQLFLGEVSFLPVCSEDSAKASEFFCVAAITAS